MTHDRESIGTKGGRIVFEAESWEGVAPFG